jgi:hypothetical protein
MIVHHLVAVRFRGRRLLLTADGRESAFDGTAISPILAGTGKKERESFVISPSGYGIHWPLLNEDLSIDALIGAASRDSAANRRH